MHLHLKPQLEFVFLLFLVCCDFYSSLLLFRLRLNKFPVDIPQCCIGFPEVQVSLAFFDLYLFQRTSLVRQHIENLVHLAKLRQEPLFARTTSRINVNILSPMTFEVDLNIKG